MDLRNTSVSAFVDSDTRMQLEPPHKYVSVDGTTAETRWTLHIGFAQQVTLYFDDPADLDRLAALLTARS